VKKVPFFVGLRVFWANKANFQYPTIKKREGGGGSKKSFQSTKKKGGFRDFNRHVTLGKKSPGKKTRKEMGVKKKLNGKATNQLGFNNTKKEKKKKKKTKKNTLGFVLVVGPPPNKTKQLLCVFWFFFTL